MSYKGWTSVKATNGRIADKHQLCGLALLPITVGQRNTWLFRVAVGRPRAALQLAEVCVGATMHVCQLEVHARASYSVGEASRTALAGLALHRVLVDLRRRILGGTTRIADAVAVGRHHRAHVDAICSSMREFIGICVQYGGTHSPAKGSKPRATVWRTRAQENLSTLFSATQPPTSTCSDDTSYLEPFSEKVVAQDVLLPGWIGMGGGGGSPNPAKKRPGAVPRCPYPTGRMQSNAAAAHVTLPIIS